MKHTPFFSVCIPTRNRKKLLKETIQSVLDQTFTDYEIVINDNASTDGTETYCLSLMKENPKLFYKKNDSDLGFVENVRKVMNRATGKYVFLLGDDDLLVPSCLEIFHKVLITNKNIGTCKSDIFAFFQPHKENLYRTFVNKKKDIVLPPESYAKIMDYYATFISGWVFKNEKPLEIGNGHQDAFLDTAFSLNKRQNFYFISKPLVGQGVHKNLGYTFYSFTSPWFEMDTLMRKYLTGARLSDAIRRIKLNMVDDSHNLKISGGKSKYMAHFVWFFTDPVPKTGQLRFITKTVLLIICPNIFLFLFRKIAQQLALVRNKSKFKEIWI